MEFFLPLAVMTMLISCLSMFLIEYQEPVSSTDSSNTPPSNPSDLTGNSAEEILVSENIDVLNPNAFSEEITTESSIKNLIDTKSFSWTF